jgi:tetratricopeptide (TPR) repeat protein
VLATDATEAEIFPEVVDIVNTICQDESNCKELTELQMQLYYCMDTDNDQKTIHDEIMPDLVNGSRIQMSQGGGLDMDEDSLEDILHPDALERDMDKMEKSMKRMADMQKQGTDIYYAGFRQMKRFPFFQDISSWFAPFMPNHPAIAHLWEKDKGSKMLHHIANVGSFCDSDKYSLVLAFEQVRSQLPSKMIEMMDNGSATPMPVGGEVDPEEKTKPAYIRRIYLQNLYRFYNIFDKRFEFPNPFEKDRSLLFFTCSLFNETPLKRHFHEVASFLIKRQHADDALRILEMIPQEQYNYQLYMMKGGICRHKKSLLAHAADCFQKALELNPDDERAMIGLARASFDLGCYEAAIENYEKLLQIQPEKKSYMLYLAYSLSNMYRYNEAEKYLYKLNYEYPDDLYVKRGLAEVLTGQDKYEQALSLYEQLLAVAHSQADDLKSYAFCLWFANQNDEAVGAFKKYVELRKAAGETTDFREMLLVEKAEMLRRHHISQMDVLLMLDAVNYL